MHEQVQRQTSRDAPRFVVAIDGGGSKTECLVASATGQIVGHGLGGSVNLGFVERAVATRSIDDALGQALAGTVTDVAVVCLGATVTEDFARPLIDRWLRYDRFLNVGEAQACLASATPEEAGAVVLAGTGAFCWARNRHGEAHRTDGWGTLLGDQGSAYDLVRRALVAAARAVDGRGPSTLLVERFCDHFDVIDLKMVSRRIYQGRMLRHEIAALAPLVAEVAPNDPVAAAVLRETGHLLAEGLLVCIERVGLIGIGFDVALCGGVFRANAVEAPLAEVLRTRCPTARLIRPIGPPVIGALALALAELGHQPDCARLALLARDYSCIVEREGAR